MDQYSMTMLGQGVVVVISLAGGVWGFMKFAVPRAQSFARTVTQFAALPVTVNGMASQVFEKIDGLGRDVRRNIALQRARGNRSDQGEFESDHEGRCVHSNSTYLKWCERANDEVKGWGWLSSVCAADRDDVREEWVDCVRERRDFRMRYRMVTASGEEFPVETVAYVLADGGLLLGWNGYVTKLPASVRGLNPPRAQAGD